MGGAQGERRGEERREEKVRVEQRQSEQTSGNISVDDGATRQRIGQPSAGIACGIITWRSGTVLKASIIIIPPPLWP